MPPTFKNIKFGRRKSQGNSLDDGAVVAPTTGFRVISREDASRKSIGNVLDLRKAATYNPSLPSSIEDDSGSSNRGSHSSASTLARSHVFDNTNTQPSWMPTFQSPTEAKKKDRSPSPHLLKLDSEFDSGLGDIFKSMESRKSNMLLDDSMVQPFAKSARSDLDTVLPNPPKAFSHLDRNTNPPPPLNYGIRREMTASPPTVWEKRTSRDGLMSSPERNYDVSPTREQAPPPPPKHKSPVRNSKQYTHLRSNEPDEPLHHTNSLRSQNSFTQSGANEDADALMVRDSVRAMRASTLNGFGRYTSSSLSQEQLNSPRSPSYPPTKLQLTSSSDASQRSTSSSSSSLNHGHTPVRPMQREPATNSSHSTPRAVPADPSFEEDEQEDMFDDEIVQAIQQANTRSMLGLPERPPVQPGKKVMSVAEFNKQKANLKYATRIQASQDSDSDDGYEDDDDDPIIQAQKRRMEQQREAQHAVWRQRMKKEIGDQSSLSPRPDYPWAGQSAPSIMFNGASQPDDEDDDVPLGILQAHNFPGAGKVPDSRMSQSSYVGVPVRGSPSPNAGQRASQLPPFARRLPEDPYFGAADLSTPSSREPLNLKSTSRSIYGGPQPGTSPVPGIPPGGLVNVIAQEESMRHNRRGSSNAIGGAMAYNMPGMGNVSGHIGASPMQGEDSLRNQQMLELMQQNSFMMKEMMDMRTQMQLFSMGSLSTSMPMAGLPTPNIGGHNQSSLRNITPPTMHGRSMSFVGPAPNMAFMQQQATAGAGARSIMNMPFDSPHSNYGPASGYTPSIAPSERSNIGQPSRYKPVNFGDGGSTITPGSTPRTLMTPGAAQQDQKKLGYLSAKIHTSGRKTFTSSQDGDEDEEQWGAKKQRR